MLCALSCTAPPEYDLPSQGYLVQKGPYQALYGKNGRIVRLLHDENGDGKPEAVSVFRPDGSPERVETDTDNDGVVDRWEYLVAAGLEKIGSSRRTPGRPDLWVYPDPSGTIRRRDLDERGDGSVDRIEHYAGSRLVKVEVDSDGDGRLDRWQDWGSGRLGFEDLDTDGDGNPDRRLRYAIHGDVVAVEVLGSRPGLGGASVSPLSAGGTASPAAPRRP